MGMEKANKELAADILALLEGFSPGLEKVLNKHKMSPQEAVSCFGSFATYVLVNLGVNFADYAIEQAPETFVGMGGQQVTEMCMDSVMESFMESVQVNVQNNIPEISPQVGKILNQSMLH